MNKVRREKWWENKPIGKNGRFSQDILFIYEIFKLIFLERI